MHTHLSNQGHTHSVVVILLLHYDYFYQFHLIIDSFYSRLSHNLEYFLILQTILNFCIILQLENNYLDLILLINQLIF